MSSTFPMTSSKSSDRLTAAFSSSLAGQPSSEKNTPSSGYWKLSSDLRNRMRRLVDTIREESKAKCIMVITDSGSPLVTSGEIDGVDGIAALGVGAYHAMSRLISLCGLGVGRSVYHQGELGGVLMAALSEGVIVVLVLENVLSPGLARFVLQREAQSLDNMISEALCQ